MVPSVSSVNMIPSLMVLRTVPVKANSIGCEMLSNGTALALLTDVRIAPDAGETAISAKKMDKTAFMDWRNYITGNATPLPCSILQILVGGFLREAGVCCYYGHGKA